MSRDLERQVRLVLYAYPAGYRIRRGDEIVATLLDSAQPGQRLPHPADAADLIWAGLRERLNMAGPAISAGAAVAAPFALAVAAGVSGFLWWRVEPVTLHTGWSYQTLGPVMYASWLLALAVRVVRPVSARAAIATAIGLTVAIPLAAAPLPIERLPLWTVMLLAGLGLLALWGGPATVDERQT